MSACILSYASSVVKDWKKQLGYDYGDDELSQGI